MADVLLSADFQQSECPLRREVWHWNNLVKHGILTSNVPVPSYINQLDRRDECQPAPPPQPNDIIRPGSSVRPGASLPQKPEGCGSLARTEGLAIPPQSASPHPPWISSPAAKKRT